MILAQKYKLKPNLQQKLIMSNWLSMLRSHYNYCLRDRIDSYEEVRCPREGNYSDIRTTAECCPLTCSISKNSQIGDPFKGTKRRNTYEIQSSELPALKKARPWYKTIHSTVLQQNLRRLDTAFQNFFNQKDRGYPKFKAKHRFKSFNYPPNQIKLQRNKIYLPGIGWMRFFNSRSIPEGFSLRSVTVREKANGWYVSIQIEDKTIPQSLPKDLNQVESVIGCDLGIKKQLSLFEWINGQAIAYSESPYLDSRGVCQ